MIDASHWKLRGPVRTLRSETAEWDAAANDWQPGRFFQFVAFDRHGRVIQLDQPGVEQSVFRTTYTYDADGRLRQTQAGTAGASIARRVLHTYDQAGRPLAVTTIGEDGIEHTTRTTGYDEAGGRTSVETLPPQLPNTAMCFGVEGSEIGYGAPGARTVTTRYDERDLPRDVLFEDASGGPVRRIVLTRDRRGRVLTEEAQNVAPFALPDSPEMSTEDREKLASLAMHAFGVMRTIFEYDDEGRMVSRTQEMGLLGEERIAYTYDDRGNTIQESRESVNREMSLNAEGQTQAGADTTRIHEIRFSYAYDPRGNWTERVVRNRFTIDAAFEPSNVERRAIEYYES